MKNYFKIRGVDYMEKFKIQKEEYVFRNIRFSKELFDTINKVKGNMSFNKFVIEAIKFAIDNMEK